MYNCIKFLSPDINYNNLQTVLNEFERVYTENGVSISSVRKPLPKTELIPMISYRENIQYIEYTVLSEKDRLTLENFPEFRVFNCDLCILSSAEKTIKTVDTTLDLPLSKKKGKPELRGLIPPYMKKLPNLASKNLCYQFRNLLISMSSKIYYPRHALVSTTRHVHTYSLYVNNDIFNDIFHIASLDENLTLFHNGSFGSTQDHFHVHISSGTYPLREKLIKKAVFFKDYLFNTKIYIFSEPVQKGVIIAGDTISNLFQVVNRIYTNLSKTGDILEKYHLLSSMFINLINGKKVYFIILFLYDIDGSGIIPNSGMVFVSNVSSIKKLDNPKLYNFFKSFEDIPNILNLNEDYLTFYGRGNKNYLSPSSFPEAPIVLISELIHDPEYLFELSLSFSITDLFEVSRNYILDILHTDKFYIRGDFSIYIKYKILLSILFKGKDNEYFKGFSDTEREMIYSIMRMEIYYLSKLYGLSTQFSILRGDALLDQLELLTNSRFFVDYVNITDAVGKGGMGQTYKTDLEYIGNSMVKFSLNPLTVKIEYLNGLETNTLRELTPNFMYVYGVISCIDDVHISPDSSYTLARPGKICRPVAMGTCPTIDNYGNCRALSNYLFIEYIYPSMTMYEFINRLPFSEMGNKDFLDNFFSVIIQIILALKVAQREIGYNHNDLHLDNVVLQYNPNLDETRKNKIWEKFEYNVMGKVYGVNVYSFIPVLIDPGNTRTNRTWEILRDAYILDEYDYYRELYTFNEDSDILSLLLDIKGLWYSRFYNSYGLDKSSIIAECVKGVYFPEEHFINKFLNTIQFNPHIKVNYLMDEENWSIVSKGYTPNGFPGINSILEGIYTWYVTPSNDKYNLVYKWGSSINSGPVNRYKKIILEKDKALREYMSRPENLEVDISEALEGMEISPEIGASEMSEIFSGLNV